MRLKTLFAATALMSLATLGAADAQMPGRHPYYLHALSDLRSARWLLDHRAGDGRVREHEAIAVQEIDRAISEIKRAAIDDGRDLNDHPIPDEREYGGRLRRADELLHKVHNDVAREEDDPAVRGLRNRAVGHIDEAIRQTDRAIFDLEHGR